jgi:choline dehydrogenase
VPLTLPDRSELAERGSGCAVRDEIVEDGTRRSPYRALVAPRRGQRNLTVLTQTLVTRVVFEGDRAVGVEALSGGSSVRFLAAREVVLSLGAVQTPKILMQSGIGPARHLESHGIDVRADLPGVGAGLDDHLMFGCVWETGAKELPPPPRAQAVCFWGSDGRAESPKFVMYRFRRRDRRLHPHGGQHVLAPVRDRPDGCRRRR